MRKRCRLPSAPLHLKIAQRNGRIGGPDRVRKVIPMIVRLEMESFVPKVSGIAEYTYSLRKKSFAGGFQRYRACKMPYISALFAYPSHRMFLPELSHLV
jgi:hypothetical protein